VKTLQHVVQRFLSQWYFPLALILLSSNTFATNTIQSIESNIDDLSCTGCNLILLNMDFFRADYVGFPDSASITPNIDNFFKNSIKFENTYSTSGSSYRSGLSILTSTNPHIYDLDVRSFEILKRKHSLGRWKKIYSSAKSIAEILQSTGYHTIQYNKGTRSGRTTYLDRGFSVYRQFVIRTLIEEIVPDFGDLLLESQQPYLGLLHAVPTRLHRAYYPANRTRLDHPNIQYRPFNKNGKIHGYVVARNWGVSHHEQREAEHHIYQQQLQYADDELELLFRKLKQHEDSSIIVLYSGHGTQIGDKQIYASNGVSYESNIRVPLLIKHPSINAPVHISQRVSLIDLAPTLLDMLGIESPKSFLGKSLVPLIEGKNSTQRVIYGRNDPDEFIIVGNWKLIAKNYVTKELFNIFEDPNKINNLYKKHKYIARLLEYRPSPGKYIDIVDPKEWQLVIQNDTQYELYDLQNDPGELTNLIDEQQEIFQPMLEEMHKKKAAAQKDIARMSTQ